MAGNELLSTQDSVKEMSMSAEEATYCIFNDIRVTSGQVSPLNIARNILQNRKAGIKYYNPKDPKIVSLTGKARTKGDMTRYAGDILDYMELANLLESHNGYFTLKGNEASSIKAFAEDNTFFNGYERLYKKRNVDTSDLSKNRAIVV